MTNVRFLDTNVIIRYFTQDSIQKAERARELFDRIDDGEVTVVVTHLVLFEVVFLLQKTYRVSPLDIQSIVTEFLRLPNVRVADAGHFVDALDLFATQRIAFADAYNAIFMRDAEITEIYSWDKEFDRVPWLTRVEP